MSALDLAALRRLAEAARDAEAAAGNALTGTVWTAAIDELRDALRWPAVLALIARVERTEALEAALREAIDWHESQRKAIGKQPPNNDGEWRRLQHWTEMERARAALAPPEDAT